MIKEFTDIKQKADNNTLDMSNEICYGPSKCS